jgi:ketosteroid isomerase-like protein
MTSSCTSTSDTGQGDVTMEIRAVMEAQQSAWNRGDVEGFMEGYERAESTTFVSGDELTRGWQTVLARYKQRYNSREQMGVLDFSDLDVQLLSASYAIVDGRWRLTRGDSLHGRFTLIFRKTNDQWRIIHDTTTSAEP